MIVAGVGILISVLLFGTSNNTMMYVLGMAFAGFSILSMALRILLLYLADQSQVIDRQTQQLARVEKHLENIRQVPNQSEKHAENLEKRLEGIEKRVEYTRQIIREIRDQQAAEEV